MKTLTECDEIQIRFQKKGFEIVYRSEGEDVYVKFVEGAVSTKPGSTITLQGFKTYRNNP